MKFEIELTEEELEFINKFFQERTQQLNYDEPEELHNYYQVILDLLDKGFLERQEGMLFGDSYLIRTNLWKYLKPQLNKRKKTVITNITSEDDFNFVVKHFDLKVAHQKWNMVIDVLIIGEDWWDVSNTIHLLYNNDYNDFEIVNINKLR